MIKRKDGMWLIYSDGKTYREGSEYFKTYDEAKAAEAKLPPVPTKPVQTLNVSSETKGKKR
jgi:hypothetical protein